MSEWIGSGPQPSAAAPHERIMMRMANRPIVGVMGSGTDSHARLSRIVGRLVAESGAHLLTGGGQGVMAAVSEAFTTAPVHDRGLCLGIIPCRSESDHRPKPGYPNAFVELPIHTHLWKSGSEGRTLASRNAINILSSDAIIALPGGPGTISEIGLAIESGKPIALFGDDPAAVLEGPSTVPRITDPDDLRAFLRRHLDQRGRPKA